MLHNNVVLHELEEFFQNKTFYSSSVIQNEDKIQKIAEIKSLALFKEVAARVPAYKDFLLKNSVAINAIKTIPDFSHLPAMTKKNYIEEYSVADRSWDGKLSAQHIISTSSGTTGQPHFWPRNLQAEIEGAYAHEFLLKEFFHIDKKDTLFVNGFAMGNWIAGTFTQSCVQLLSWKGYKVSVMSPGYNLESVCEVVEKMKDYYQQIIICGHTPFLKEVIEALSEHMFDWKKNSVSLLGTGQAVTENWRKYIEDILCIQPNINRFFNLYGSADAALMGFETPQSIALRSYFALHSEKSQSVFASNRLPSLYNYDPRLTYFETEEGELLITKNSGCPLVRYNIHDQGGIIESSKMEQYSQDSKVLQNAVQALPYVFLFGRDKFMVKLYGANIYSEHAQHALSHTLLQKHITGRYLMEVAETKEKNPQLIIRLERRQNIEGKEELVKLIQDIFIQEVSSLNKEYSYILKELGEKVRPQIITHTYQDHEYFPAGVVKKTG